MTRENPNPPAPEQDRPRDSRHLEQNDQPVPGNEIDEFLGNLYHKFGVWRFLLDALLLFG